MSNDNECKEQWTFLSTLKEHYTNTPNHNVLSWVDSKCKVVHRMTYRELWEQSGAVADMLEHRGIKSGDRVMIAYPFGLEFLAGMFGCMRIGVIPCSAYPPNPMKLQEGMEILNKQAKDAGTDIVLTTRKFSMLLTCKMLMCSDKHKLKLVATDTLRPNKRLDSYLPVLSDTAFIQYTSGSTGFPKGVMISHHSLLGNAKQYTKVALEGLNPEQAQQYVGINWCPQYHDMGLIGFFMTILYSGATGYNCSPLDFIKQPLLWHNMIMKYGGSHCGTQGPNFAYGLVMKRMRQARILNEKWTNVNRLCIGAEPVDPKVLVDVFDFLKLKKRAIGVGYGMAEVGLFVSVGVGIEIFDGIPSSGPVNDFSKVRVVKHGEVVAQEGEVGELYVQSPVVASGYWGQGMLTEETFKNNLQSESGNWLATGDLGKIVKGKFYVTGRKKDVIIVNGKNYYPIDIERTIEDAFRNQVRQGCVAAFQHSPLSAGITVEVRKGISKDEIPLATEISKLVSVEHGVKITYCLICNDHTLPKTTSGKLKRNEIQRTSLANEWPRSCIISTFDTRSSINSSTTLRTVDESSNFSSFLTNKPSEVLATTNTPTACPFSRKNQLNEDDTAKVCPVTGRTLPEDHPRRAPNPLAVGSSTGTQNVYQHYGIHSFFSYYRDGKPYNDSDGFTETPYVEYKTIVPKLEALDDEQNSGQIDRAYVLGMQYMRNFRFWTEVPGIPPHCMSTGLVGKEHKDVRDWLKLKFSQIANDDYLRVSARKFFLEQQPILDTDKIYHWVSSILFELFFGRNPSKRELVDLTTFRNKVMEMVMRRELKEDDDKVLHQKAAYVKQFMEEGDLSQSEACSVVDTFMINASQTVAGIRAGLALLCGKNSEVELEAGFVLNESNALQFSWECIRRFPMVAGIGWWENKRAPGNQRTVCALHMAGRDPSIWGEDSDKFRPSRFSAAGFDSRSIFFSEPSRERSCPAKSGVIRMMTCFFTEFATSGNWKSHDEDRITWFDGAPYVGPKVRLQIVPRVTVIGAGIAGLVAALNLAQRGLKVALIEKNEVIGGHARHTEAFGHHRNPAFGCFNDHQYPNLVKLIEKLNIEKVFVCPSKDFRHNLTEDGSIPSPNLPQDTVRFLSEMLSLFHSGGAKDETIGQYLDRNNYSEEFILHVFMGKVIHFFAGLSTEEYLEIPVSHISWIVVGDMMHDAEAPIYRLKNAQYMAAMQRELSNSGVEVISGVDPQLLARDERRVIVGIGTGDNVRHIESDYLVISTPPNAAAKFLGRHIGGEEWILSAFDCPLETVVMHQDESWVSKDTPSALYGMLPGKESSLPTRQDTIPLTTLALSDSDGKTPLFVTHAFKTFNKLKIAGPTKLLSFTHTRITLESVRCRELLLKANGKQRTYFAGGWTHGFMLHEDAIVSGLKAVNSIFEQCGEATIDILPRAVELHSARSSPLDISNKPVRSQISPSPKTSWQPLIIQLIEETVGHSIKPTDSVGSLGLGSMDASALHALLLDKLDVKPEEFPVDWLFDADMKVKDLTAKIDSNISMQASLTGNHVRGSFENDTNVDMVLKELIEETVGYSIRLSDTVGSLGLGSMDASALHALIVEKLSLDTDSFPVDKLFETEILLEDLISSLADRSTQSTTKGPISTGDSKGKPGNGRENSGELRVQTPRFELTAFALLLQIVSVFVPPLYIGSTIIPSLLFGLAFYERIDLHKGLQIICFAPVFTIIFATTAALLLVILKWILIGKARPGSRMVWGPAFAGRWIIGRCCKLCFRYTPWRNLHLTPAMNLLYRLLGCTVGKNARIQGGAIMDFDLVQVGYGTLVAGDIDTATVSLGVETLSPVHIGSNCSIRDTSVIGKGSTLGDDVIVEKRCYIDEHSSLQSKSCWRGLPAVQYKEGGDLEDQNDNGTEVFIPTLLDRFLYHSVAYFVGFWLWPLVLMLEFSPPLMFAYWVYPRYGIWLLALFLWIPFSVSFLLAIAITLTVKWTLLGRVKPGEHPLFGSFHRRKLVVDHFVEMHMREVGGYASMTGSPISSSMSFQRVIQRLFGAKLGKLQFTGLKTSLTFSYDLISIGDRVALGAASDLHVWSEANGYLIGKPIVIEENVNCGTHSDIAGGVTLKSGCLIASYSFAFEDVESNEMVLGLNKFPKRAESAEDSMENDHDHDVDEMGVRLGSVYLWFLTGSLVVLSDSLIGPESFEAFFDSDLAVMNSVYFGVGLALAFGVVLPLFAFIAIVSSKRLFVGTFLPGNVFLGNFRSIRIVVFNILIAPLFNGLFLQIFAGTCIENFFQRVMGATIGKRVYLQNCNITEADLVTIGDDCAMNYNANLVPHQRMPGRIEYAPIHIGERCTMGRYACLYGRDSVDSDATLCPLTKPLMGTRLQKGKWIGYPAKNIGPVDSIPCLPEPIWCIVLHNLVGFIRGCLWAAYLFILKKTGRNRRTSPRSVQSAALPKHFQGFYSPSEGDFIVGFEQGIWSDRLRMLWMPGGRCFQQQSDGALFDPWYDWASYQWSFDSSLKKANGRICFGRWTLPSAFASATLTYVGDSKWIWKECWFDGHFRKKVTLFPVDEDKMSNIMPGWSWPTSSLPSGAVIKHNTLHLSKRRLNMHYASLEPEGTGDNVPILLLHGFPEASYSWITQLSGLGGRRVVVPDLRGFGETHTSDGNGTASVTSSDGNATALATSLEDSRSSLSADSEPRRDLITVLEQVEDLVELLDRLGIDRFVVAGHDAGGIVAWAMLKCHPERLLGIISVGMPYDALNQIGGDPMYPTQPPLDRIREKRSRGETSPLEYALDLAENKFQASNPRAALCAMYTSPESSSSQRDTNLLPQHHLEALLNATKSNPLTTQTAIYRAIDDSYQQLLARKPRDDYCQQLPILVITCGKDYTWTPERCVKTRDVFPNASIHHEAEWTHFCLTQQDIHGDLGRIIASWVDDRISVS